MKRITLLLTFVFISSVSVLGQDPYARYLAPKATDPVACRAGEIWINSTSHLFKICPTANSISTVGNAGDVVGPASSTDNAIVRFDSTAGKLIQNSVVTIADTSGNIAGVGTLNTHTIPGGTDTLTLNNATQTLINKTLTAPVVNSPTGIVKGDVGLGNVDNTSDANKPVSTAQQTALDLKANLASPTFTGTPTLPTGTIATTQSASDNTTKVATTAFVTTADNLKANLASPTFTGVVTHPTPFTVGATSVTTTGTQLNYLNAATGTTGTTSTNLVFSTSPAFITPDLGTPSAAVLTSATGLPISTGISGLGTGVATFLATPSSANLMAAVTDETGTSGALVFSGSPVISTPRIAFITGNTTAAGTLTFRSTSGVGTSDAIIFQVGNNGATEAGRFTTVANLKVAGTAVRGTTEGTNHIDIFDGTAPVGTLANGISLYSTSGELRVADAGGNATLLSPHDHSTNEWIFYSVNTTTGKVLRIDMERMMRDLNARLGGGYIHESNSSDTVTTRMPSASPAIAPLPGNIGGTQVLTPTPSATVTLTIDTTTKHVLAVWTAGEAETINISGTPQDGTMLTTLVTNDGVLGRTLTFNTGLSSSAVAIGVVSKRSTVTFVASGGTFYEIARSIGF